MPVSLCAGYGSTCCQSVYGLWQFYRIFGGLVCLSVFVRAMAAHAVSLCVDYGSCTIEQVL